MQQPQFKKDKLVSVLKDFINSINSNSQVTADMSALIEATSQLPLASFNYWEHLIRSEFYFPQNAVTPPKWRLWSKPKELLTWLDLINGDGYKREKTLRTLAGAAPNSFFFLLAIRRLNDWVPQVRDAARQKLPDIAIATNPAFVVEALCVALSNWHSWGRIEHADKEILLQIICEKKVAELLIDKLITSSCGPMPSLLSQLGRTSILDGEMMEISTSAIQPSVRAKAYRSLFEGKSSWIEGRKWEWTDKAYCKGRLKPIISDRRLLVKTPSLDLIKSAAKDRSAIVRRISAEILIRDIEKLGVIARELAENFATDKSKAVSERGRFALKQLDELGCTNSSQIEK